jgi:hypothetical protein
MISIIVSSKNPDFLCALSLNIAATIGNVYEILAFDNRFEKKGLCEVYNRHAERAKYNIICFMHEDVFIHTAKWGESLLKLLADKSIGLVGISGAVFKSRYSGVWSSCDKNLYRTNSIQHFKNNKEPVAININKENNESAEVAIIDGVFMATRKDVFSSFSFDEKLLKGFHGYDIDYSLQVGQKYKLVVSYSILLEHLSEGTLSAQWLHDSMAIHKKWKKILPVKVFSLTDRELQYNNYLSISNVLNVSLKFVNNNRLVITTYLILISKFWKFNKFRYSKAVLKYFLLSNKRRVHYEH